MITAGRAIRWTMMAIAAAMCAAIGSWLLPDQKLDAEIETLLAQPAPVPQQNGYFLLLGFKASPATNPHAVGQQIAAEHERLLAAREDLSAFTVERFLGPSPLDVTLAVERCDLPRQNCLKVYQRWQDDVFADSKKYAAALDRYRSLRGYAQFSEHVMSMTMLSPLPSYGPVLNLSTLIDAQAAVLAAAPASRQTALEMLAAEVRTWRRVLRGGDLLITQMAAAAALHHKYRLASEIMQAYPDTVVRHAELMAEITAPLSSDEIDMRRALEGEFRYAANAFRHMQPHLAQADSERPFIDTAVKAASALGGYKPHATLNLAYAMHRDNVRRYADNAGAVLQAYVAPGARGEQPWPWHPANLFYNPVGKILVSLGAFDYSEYAFRLHDLAGHSRLVELQRRIIEAKVAPERIPAMLANVGISLMDPYSGKPMVWDAANGSLSFAGNGGRFLRDGRMAVTLAAQ